MWDGIFTRFPLHRTFLDCQTRTHFRFLETRCAVQVFMKSLWLLEALTCSRHEDGLSCRHSVKLPLVHSLTHSSSTIVTAVHVIAYSLQQLIIHARVKYICIIKYITLVVSEFVIRHYMICNAGWLPFDYYRLWNRWKWYLTWLSLVTQSIPDKST